MVGAKTGSTVADIEITEKEKIGETEDYDSKKSSEKLTNLANTLK